MGESKLIGDMLGKVKNKYFNRPSPVWVLPDTTLGVEVEIEGTDFRRLNSILPPLLQHYWETHEDQSLHNGGAEFTFRVPMFGEDADVALKELLTFATKQKSWLASKRTGIHIHMDARDMSRHQLLGLVAYYTLLEPAIYAWVGADRHANNFCLPYYKAEQGLKQAQDILTAMRGHEDSLVSSARLLEVCDQYHRYAGLNLKSLAQFGSLEFRQLQTTFDYGRVRDWINLLLSLKRAALDAPESTMTIMTDVLRYGVQRTLQSVFRGNLSEVMQTENIIQQIEEFGIPNAMSLLNAVTGEAAQPKAVEWSPSAPAVDYSKTHKGLITWKEATYPKGLPNSPEEQPPPQLQPGDDEQRARLEDLLNDFATRDAARHEDAFRLGGPDGTLTDPWMIDMTLVPGPMPLGAHVRDITTGMRGVVLDEQRFMMADGTIQPTPDVVAPPPPPPPRPEVPGRETIAPRHGSRERPWRQTLRSRLFPGIEPGDFVTDIGRLDHPTGVMQADNVTINFPDGAVRTIR